MGLQRVRHDCATFISLHFTSLLCYNYLHVCCPYRTGALWGQKPVLINLCPPPAYHQAWFIFSKCFSVQFSRVRRFVTPWTAAHQTSLSITNSRSLLKLMSIELVMPSNHLILCRPLLLLPSIFPSIRVFSNESVLHIRWPKCWSFSFSISPSKEYSGLISFSIDKLNLLAVQGTLKSLLQQHSSKASVFQCSTFFVVQLSHPCMTTEKTIALTRWQFVSKQCLCFVIYCLGLS